MDKKYIKYEDDWQMTIEIIAEKLGCRPTGYDILSAIEKLQTKGKIANIFDPNGLMA